MALAGASARSSTPLLNPAASFPKLKRSDSVVKRSGQRSVVLLEREAGGQSELNAPLVPAQPAPASTSSTPAKLNPREMAEIRSLFRRGVLEGPLCGVDGVVTALDMLHIAVPLRQVVPIALAAQVQGRVITQELLVEVVKEVKAKYLNQLPRSFADDVMDGFRGLDALLPPRPPSSDEDEAEDIGTDVSPKDLKMGSAPPNPASGAATAPQQETQVPGVVKPTVPPTASEIQETSKEETLMRAFLSEEHYERYLEEERYLRCMLEEQETAGREAERRRRRREDVMRQVQTNSSPPLQRPSGPGDSIWATTSVSVDRVDVAIRSAFDLPYGVFRPDTAPAAIRLPSWRQAAPGEPSKNSSSSGTASPNRGSFFLRRSGSLPPTSLHEAASLAPSPTSNADRTQIGGSPTRPDLSPTASTTRSPEEEIRPIDALWRMIGGSEDPLELESKMELPLALFGGGSDELHASVELTQRKSTRKGTFGAKSSRSFQSLEHSTDTAAGTVPSALRRLQSKMGSYLMLAATLRSTASRSEGTGDGASASFILPDEAVDRSESGDSDLSGAPSPKASAGGEGSGLRGCEPPIACRENDNFPDQEARKHNSGTLSAQELLQRKNHDLNVLYQKILARKEKEALKKQEDLGKLHSDSQFGVTGPGAVLLAAMNPTERTRLGGLAVHPEAYLRNGNTDIYCTGLRQAQQRKRQRNAKESEEKRKLDLEIQRLQEKKDAARKQKLATDLHDLEDLSSATGGHRKKLRFSLGDTPNQSQQTLSRAHKHEDLNASDRPTDPSPSTLAESPFLFQSICFVPEGEEGDVDDELLQLASGLAGHGLKHRCKESTAVKRSPLKEFSCRFTSEGVREPKLAQALRAECDLAVAKISQDSAGKHKRLGLPQRTYLLKL